MNKASVARRMGISEHTVKQYVDRARVAVAGTADTVAVSVVADGDVTVLAPAEAAGVTVTCQDEGGRLWVETRWRRG